MTHLPSSVFPDFVANQILTDTQLNELRDHLDRQDRRARLRLAGTGIVCGLTWRLETTEDRCTIFLDPGFGLTSAGHLLEAHEPLTLTRSRAYELPAPEEGEIDVAADLRGSTALPLTHHELLPEDGEADLTPELCSGGVLVLFLERRRIDLRSCLVTDCNNKGQNVETTLRVLLVKGSPEALAHLEVEPGKEPPAVVHLPRFHTERDPKSITRALEIDVTWGALIVRWAHELESALLESWDCYREHLALTQRELRFILKWINRVFSLAEENGSAPQEHYEALRLFATGHREWVAAACALLGKCAPGTGFDRHLLLGHLDGIDGFRHLYVASPLRDARHDRVEHARKLFRRLVAMARAFDDAAGSSLPTPEGVRSTPSHAEDRPLGERAAPRYFLWRDANGDDTRIPALWQPRDRCTVEPLWSYHAAETNGRHPIEVDYARSTLIRIEGHRGRDCTEARQTLQDQSRALNLEFDLVVADFGPDAWTEIEGLEEDLGPRLDELQSLERELRREAFETILQAESIDPILERRQEHYRKRFELGDLLWRRTQLATSLRACCGHETLQGDYAAVRSELLCDLRRLRGELTRLGDLEALPELAPPVFEAFRERSGNALHMAIGDSTVAFLHSRQDDSKAYRQEILSLFAQMERPRLLPWLSLYLKARYLISAIDDLISYLPTDLRSFYWPAFATPYHLLVAELTAAWLYLRDLWQFLERFDDDSADSTRGPFRHLDDYLFATSTGCRASRLGAVAAAWRAAEKGRDNGRWRFPQLACRHPGLEHLGGVTKGGTFVLVCDEDDRVVADFALASSLDCCCHELPTEPCLPLLAHPDHTVVVLAPRFDGGPGYQPAKARLNPVANDLDPNRSRPGWGLEVELDSEISDLGASLTLQDGRIEYHLENPTPGAIDRFTYTVSQIDDPCPAVTTGEGIVLLTGGRTTPAHGTVRGRLTRNGDPLGGERVLLLGGDGGPAVSDLQGRYAFLSVPPGSHTVQVRDTSKTGELRPGGELVLDFAFEEPPREGGIRGTVIERGAGLPSITVELVELAWVTTTSVGGTFQFLSVPEGTYNLRAPAEGSPQATGEARVIGGQIVEIELRIDSGVPPSTVTIRVFEAETDLPVPGATVRLEPREMILVPPPGSLPEETTGAEGLAVFTEVEAGELRAVAEAEGFERNSVLCQPSPEGSTVEALPLRKIRHGTIEVEVAFSKAGDFPLQDAPRPFETLLPTVSVHTLDGRVLFSESITGKLTTKQAPGRYIVWADAPRYLARSEWIELEPEATESLRFELEPVPVAPGTKEPLTPVVEELLEWIAKRNGMTTEEAAEKAFRVFGARRVAQRQSIAEQAAKLASRKPLQSVQKALAFFQALDQPRLDEKGLLEAHSAAAQALTKAIHSASTNQDRFWEILVLCDYGLLDQLVIQNPESLRPLLRQTVERHAQNARALIPIFEKERSKQRARAEQYARRWNGPALVDELRLVSPEELMALITFRRK